MGISFNADEMFSMAEQIERNGARFYRKASEIVPEPSLQQRLQDLAKWEDSHERIFAAMHTQLTEAERVPTVFDPDDENGLYLAAMADHHVFDVTTDPADTLSGTETMAEILEMALGREKDSVVFYSGMQPFITESLGRDKVGAIIKEELRHISLISQELRSLGA